MGVARWALALALVSRARGQTESLDVLGVIQQESIALNPENIRSMCYMGLIEELTTRCNILDDDGKAVPPGVFYPDRTEGWNQSPRGESDVFCLTCCNTLRDKVEERIDETWDFSCAVDSDVIQTLRTTYYGYEFRFARNRDEGDDKLVRCAMGRIGCEYEGVFGEHEMDGRDLSCTSKPGDGDYGHCTADNATCTCEIPGSQRGGTGPHPDTDARNDYLDGVRIRGSEQDCRFRSSRLLEGGRSWYLRGYELTIEVEEMSDNSGSFWRSVTGCSVKTTESLSMAPGEMFHQRIRMIGTKHRKPYNWFASAHGLPYVLSGIALALLIAALILRCCRNEPCPTCGRKLIFMPRQCFYCTLYGAPMPDPVLLARIRARARFVHGQGFVAYTLRKKAGAEQTRVGCFRLYAGRVCYATFVIVSRHVLAVLKCVLVATLTVFDAILHVFFRCVLRRRRGPGPICLRAVVPDDANVVGRDPPVPTKIYVADPVLRSANVFERLTRPMPKAERELVAAEQDHARKFHEEKRKQRLSRRQTRRAKYAVDVLAGLPPDSATPVVGVALATLEAGDAAPPVDGGPGTPVEAIEVPAAEPLGRRLGSTAALMPGLAAFSAAKNPDG